MLQLQRVAELEAYITRFMEKHNLPGLTVLLADGEETVYAQAFGHRDLEKGIETSLDTIFGIASITKSFTAMAVGKLVEQGKLGFDDPVVKHLPGFALPGNDGREVTVRNLLTHTSGMPPLDALRRTFHSHSAADAGQAQQEAMPPINTYREMLEYISTFPGKPLGRPGEYFNYSNEAYGILGALVRKVSGMPYAAFVRRHFLEPMEMARSTYSFEEMYEHDEVTLLYTKQDDGSLQASTRWPVAPGFQAAGRLKSTVLDLIKPFQMYAQNGTFGDRQLLAPEIIEETTRSRYRFSLHESYGHALHIRPDYHGVTLIHHGGAGKGISSHAGFVPERKLSAVVLTNLGGLPSGELWRALINLGLGLPIETPMAEYVTSDWTAELAEPIAGRYASVEGNAFELHWQDGKLWFEDEKGRSEVKRITDDVGLMGEQGHEQELKFYRDDATGCVRGVGRGVRFIPRAE